MMDWFALNPNDWDADTMHLDPFQDGAYFRLVRHYMKTRAPLPDNDFALARIVGVTYAEWMEKAAEVVRPFFVLKNGKLTHKRCDDELKGQDAVSRKRIKNAKNAANSRWSKTRENVDVECDTHASSMPVAMPLDATRHDTTRQDKRGEDNIQPLSSSQLQEQTSSPNARAPKSKPKAPPADPDGGFNPIGGGVLDRITERVRPSGPFDIMRIVTPDAMRKAQAASPGWDLHHLGKIYSEKVRKGDFEAPQSPDVAFIAWCKKYTKGKPPR